MSDANDEPRRVGYGNPPKETRFRPGQSGNPRGRPKGRESFPRMVDRYLNRKIEIVIDGKRTRMPVEEAGLMGLVQELLKGRPEKRIPIFKFLQDQRAPQEEPPEVYNYDLLSDDELGELMRLLYKAAGQTPPPAEIPSLLDGHPLYPAAPQSSEGEADVADTW